MLASIFVVSILSLYQMKIYLFFSFASAAENAINHTMASISIDIDQTNITCVDLKFCHHRGQCLDMDNQLKCL